MMPRSCCSDAARSRPLVAARPLAPISTALTSHRYASNVPSEPPAKKAQSLIDALPGSSLISKTAIISAGASVSAYLISNEYYVVNEETVVMVCTLSVFWAIFHFAGPMYREWAEGIQNKQRQVLEMSKQRNLDAVQQRIDDVQQLSSVVDITKGLFEVSKVGRRASYSCPEGKLTAKQETAELEARIYELEQKTALAAEAKSVLDSWVRYEGQIKTKQQKDLAENVIGKIQKELENPKTLQQILQQSIVDVESRSYVFVSSISRNCRLMIHCRDGGFKSTMNLFATVLLIQSSMFIKFLSEIKSTLFPNYFLLVGNKKETCSHLHWCNGKVADTLALQQTIRSFLALYTLLTYVLDGSLAVLGIWPRHFIELRTSTCVS